MDISMPADKAKTWFGATPPDLTLVARSRSPEWLYTYLRNFYSDPSRPLGVNNKVFKDVGMPHVLLELQGLQECAPGPVLAANGGIKRNIFTREEILENPCGRYNLISEGSLSPEEFDTEKELLLWLTEDNAGKRFIKHLLNQDGDRSSYISRLKRFVTKKTDFSLNNIDFDNLLESLA